jgi:hypothetical protein
MSEILVRLIGCLLSGSHVYVADIPVIVKTNMWYLVVDGYEFLWQETCLNQSNFMSESVKFVVYYGPGNVRSNESGVDLTEFAYVELQLTDPEKVNISQLKHWLTTNFSLDPNVCTVSIQSVWSKSRKKKFWELVLIDRTHIWVTWLESCKRRRTHPVALVLPIPMEDPLVQGGGGYEPGQVSQPIDEMDVAGSEHMDGTELEGQSDYGSHVGGDYDAGESSQNIGDSDSGEADGDEEGSEMQNLMEEEDEDGLAEDLDSENSNEEDGEENDEEVPIPASWNQNLSTGMTVNDGHESSWPDAAPWHVGDVPN